jgi:hypothetical protein
MTDGGVNLSYKNVMDGGVNLSYKDMTDGQTVDSVY